MIKKILKKTKLLSGKNKWFLDDLKAYKKTLTEMGVNTHIELFPQLNDKTTTTGFDTHYTYQGPWVFNKLLINKPKKHVDIGSSVMYLGFFAAYLPTEFIDIRPTKLDYKNFTEKEGSILDLPYKSGSLESVSCLHVIEHIGLGRYGDNLDPEGAEKTCKELSRVIKKNGNIYISTPVGKEVTYFNAHRVFNPKTIINYFPGFKLMEFSGINDKGRKIVNTKPEGFQNQNYALGMFWFKRIE